MSDLLQIENDLQSLVATKFYPCVAAVQSLAKRDYQIYAARRFGHGVEREKLRAAIFGFIKSWTLTRSTTSTLVIAYPGESPATETEFEKLMWNEISSLTSIEERDQDWAPGWSQDPADRKFTLCLGGHALFVVGLHPKSSRKGRRFPYPALIFNLFDQFEDLQRQGAYHTMVAKNRERDIRFQGAVNPMAAEWGETWETIQFSGKQNSSDWKCPFHFSKKSVLGSEP